MGDAVPTVTVEPTATPGKVAIVGSGPAGMAAAQQLARAGHDVVVFEKNSRVGGLLRYGIPDFKLEKSTIDRRIAQMEAEGVAFRTCVCVGADPEMTGVTNDGKEVVSAEQLKADFDAVMAVNLRAAYFLSVGVARGRGCDPRWQRGEPPLCSSEGCAWEPVRTLERVECAPREVCGSRRDARQLPR